MILILSNSDNAQVFQKVHSVHTLPAGSHRKSFFYRGIWTTLHTLHFFRKSTHFLGAIRFTNTRLVSYFLNNLPCVLYHEGRNKPQPFRDLEPIAFDKKELKKLRELYPLESDLGVQISKVWGLKSA